MPAGPETTAPTRRERRRGGSAAVAIGVFGLVLMYRHPESLRVPAWVGFPAMATFVWAGAAILMREYEGARRLADGAVLLAIAGLFLPAAWVAFGPGPRECTATLVVVGTAAGEWACRGVFGVGALIAALLFVLAARALLAKR